MSKKIILIDTNNLAYRAFYALPDTISTSTGEITNAVFGFTSMLLKIMEEHEPDVIICAFDSKGPTFRHKILKDYKATRKEMPDELSSQMILIKELLDSFNIASIEVEGYEADDIIATAAIKTSGENNEIVIVSSDKDILQLVSDGIKVLSMKRGITDTVTYNKENVIKKFGIKPGLIKDFLALTGDVSDNIPGVRGIGPKTAKGLIQSFGSIEKIYERIEDIKSDKIRDLLIKNKDIAEKSKKLTMLETNLDLKVMDIVNSGFVEGIEFGQVEKFFNTLEFNTLKKRLRKIAGIYKKDNKIFKGRPKSKNEKLKKDNNSRTEVHEIFINNAALKELQLRAGGKLFISVFNLNKGIDNCKRPPHYLDCILIMDKSNNFYLFGKAFLLKDNYSASASISSILSKNGIVKSGYDFKKIYKFFKKIKVGLKGLLVDYKIMYLLLNPTRQDVTAGELLTDIAGIDHADIRDMDLSLGTGKAIENNIKSLIEAGMQDGQMSFGFNPPYSEIENPKNDSSVDKVNNIDNLKKVLDKTIFKIKEMLYYKKVDRILNEKILDEELNEIYFKIEEPLIKILAEIELKGVKIDLNYLSGLIRQYDKDIRNLTKEIYDLCGKEFNINSTQQLSRILYEELKLTPTRRTKTGFSTDAVSLLANIDFHPVIGKILDYREKVKLKNTYIDVLPNLVDSIDGRIHTTYNQLGTTTGRISSNNPNLQNIPVRSELGRQIRKAFVPGEGYDLIISADYSQIELRILAHLSEDQDLIEAFNSGQDIHRRTASEIFNISYDEVEDNLRRKAKAINFGILYGMTEFGLKNRLAISEEEARDYIKMYFSRYPVVKKYIDHLIESAYRTGFATTMFGRKRYIGELASSNTNIRNLGERLAINTPIQGSAADIMKLAMVKLYNSIIEKKIDANIILNVHDEIVIEFKKKDRKELKKIVSHAMENCVKLKTRLKVDVKMADNWYI